MNKCPVWIEQELAGCHFKDMRLGRYFRALLSQFSGSIGESIPLTCQDWANTKAAYRFFSNDRLNEADILAGHFQSTRSRFVATTGTTLILHDTCEFSYTREKPELIGITNNNHCGQDDYGASRYRTLCGILMHSSLAITTEGLPLGLAAIKFWTRKTFQGCD